MGRLWMNDNGILLGSRIIFTVPQKYILEYREPAKPKRWESLSIYIFDLQMNHTVLCLSHTVTHFHAYSVTFFWLLVSHGMSELDKSPWRSLHSLNMCVCVCVCVCVLERERENERERVYDQSHMDPSWCQPLTPPLSFPLSPSLWLALVLFPVLLSWVRREPGPHVLLSDNCWIGERLMPPEQRSTGTASAVLLELCVRLWGSPVLLWLISHSLAPKHTPTRQHRHTHVDT